MTDPLQVTCACVIPKASQGVVGRSYNCRTTWAWEHCPDCKGTGVTDMAGEGFEANVIYVTEKADTVPKVLIEFVYAGASVDLSIEDAEAMRGVGVPDASQCVAKKVRE